VNPGVVCLREQVIVRVNISVRIGQLILGVLQVHRELAARLASCLATELALGLVVLNKVCEFLSAKDGVLCWVCLAIVKGNQSWGDFAVV